MTNPLTPAEQTSLRKEDIDWLHCLKDWVRWADGVTYRQAPTPQTERVDRILSTLRAQQSALEAAEGASSQLIEFYEKWFKTTGSSVSQRWDRIPPEERLAVVTLLAALTQLCETLRPEGGAKP
jgi:hypothetical protein